MRFDLRSSARLDDAGPQECTGEEGWKKQVTKKPTQTRGVYWKNGHHLVATPAVALGPADE